MHDAGIIYPDGTIVVDGGRIVAAVPESISALITADREIDVGGVPARFGLV